MTTTIIILAIAAWTAGVAKAAWHIGRVAGAAEQFEKDWEAYHGEDGE